MSQSNITRVEYPDGANFIRVVFEADGSVRVSAPLSPSGGTEVYGEPLNTEPLEIARLMNFAYNLGMRKGAAHVVENSERSLATARTR